jgi:hypothetical protein
MIEICKKSKIDIALDLIADIKKRLKIPFLQPVC